MSFLVLFAGGGDELSWLPRALRARGHRVQAIDTKLGGGEHDVLRNPLSDSLLHRIEQGEFDAVFAAPPCSSFSVRHPVTLRTAAQVDGIVPLPAGWEAYITKHNGMARFAAAALRAAHQSGTPAALENPADRHDNDSPAYWKEEADHGSIFRFEEMSAALEESGATPYTFAQCAEELGGDAQKWTTITGSLELADELRALRHMVCSHAAGTHKTRLEGCDEHGRPRATRAAAYPAGMNELLADALVRAGRTARTRREGGRPPPPSAASSEESERPEGAKAAAAEEGRIADGFELGPIARAACDSARHIPQRFASARNLVHAHTAELRSEAFPGNLHQPVVPSKPGGKPKAGKRKRLPRAAPWLQECQGRACTGERSEQGAAAAGAKDGAAAARLRAVLPSDVHGALPQCIRGRGSIRIAEQYNEGVYETGVQDWLRDCSDPADCRPVQ